VFTDYFASKNISSVPTSFNGRSDYAPFIAEGVDIPSGGLFTGAEGIKTEEQAKLFGGTAGVAYDVNYHAKGDTYDNLNFEAFLINAKVAIFDLLHYAYLLISMFIGFCSCYSHLCSINCCSRR
jgi:carboxypeptidase Q